MNKLPFEKIKRKILVKQKGFKILKARKKTADELLANGMINLNKPAGLKSIHCGNKIREALEVARSGHAGTLDPAVQGVLPILIGRGVKLSKVLSEAGKKYLCEMRLHGDVGEKKIRAAFKKFTGLIEQLPPRISAVKRVMRKRKVYYVDIKEIKERRVKFEIGCEAGTYIRKYVHDLGQFLKVGAHMAALRRIQAGPFKIEDSITLERVRANYKKWLSSKEDELISEIILPVESAVEYLPKVWVEDGVIPHLKHGSPVFVPGIVQLNDKIKVDDTIAIFSLENKLLALGKAGMTSSQILKRKKGLAVKTDVVLV